MNVSDLHTSVNFRFLLISRMRYFAEKRSLNLRCTCFLRTMVRLSFSAVGLCLCRCWIPKLMKYRPWTFMFGPLALGPEAYRGRRFSFLCETT